MSYINNKGYEIGWDKNMGHIPEHTLIAQRVLGKKLPSKVIVHHINENKADNSNSNLVICPNQEYHTLLHKRAEALEACGNPNYRKCIYCKEWDDPSNMSERAQGNFYHKCCNAVDSRKRYEASKAARQAYARKRYYDSSLKN